MANVNIDVELDPNHTHFILVDDGSCGAYGKEIEFRAKLENELRKGKSNIYYEACRKRKRLVSESAACETIMEEEKEDEDNDEQMNENINGELKSGLKKDTIPMVLIVGI